MNISKIQLKKVIRKIVERKLNEIVVARHDDHHESVPTSEYGFIMQGNGSPENPVIQLLGYGNMSLDMWRKKIVKDLEEVLRHARNGNFVSAQYLLGIEKVTPENGSVISSEINMIADLDTSKSNLEEDSTTTTQTTNSSTTKGADQSNDTATTPSATHASPSTASAAPVMTQADQLALAAAQKDIQTFTAQRDQLNGAIKKLQEPIQHKVADINKRLAPIEKKLGQATQKATDIQDKYKT
jgi:hypothetical protein